MHVLVSALSRFTEPTGICRHAANLVMALGESGSVNRTTLVIGAWQEEYFRAQLGLAAKEDIAVHTIDIRNSSASRNLWFVSALPKLAQQLSADVVHLSFPVPVFRRKYDCPVVVTLHDLYPYDVPSNFGYPNVLFVRAFLHSCLNGVDAIACVSNTTQSRLGSLDHGRYISKSVVIPNVVRMDSESRARPPALRFEQYVLCVAQHRLNKNLPLAIRGFAEMRATGAVPRETGLVIVGAAGPETTKLENAVKTHALDDSVQFLSSLRQDELGWLYEHCELFLVTSTHEGFCLPLAEALTYGCLAVCSDIPILREIGGNECYYFKLDEHAQHNLVAAARLALTNARREIAPTSYPSAKTGRSYAELYSDLTGVTPSDQKPVPSCS